MKKRVLKGFSLGEVLIAIFVFVIGVLPIFGSLSQSLGLSIRSHRIIAASGLAQEGVELARNVKDNSVLSGKSTLSAWLPTFSDQAACRLDLDDDVLDDPAERLDCEPVPIPHPADSTSYVLSPDSSGFWKHDVAEGTYRRTIFTSYDRTTESVLCLSAVSWGDYAPSDIDDVRSECVVTNDCVYTETTLMPWK